MRKVEQRTEFDCLRACLASIFDCEYDETPEIFDPLTGKQMKRGNWLNPLYHWLDQRGFRMDVFYLDGSEAPVKKGRNGELKPFAPEDYWMAGVISPYGPPDHALVMHEDRIAWDPDPDPPSPQHLGFRNGYVFRCV